jgi:hypothetical protein
MDTQKLFGGGLRNGGGAYLLVFTIATILTVSVISIYLYKMIAKELYKKNLTATIIICIFEILACILYAGSLYLMLTSQDNIIPVMLTIISIILNIPLLITVINA